ncbi:aminodeoxychorismate lyase [Cytobacillus spongiae]|uniref:aminodeoxychorismate lyase n=1 Tax=Cytobacillus spongiae TaxID=2901381 RepID=UPI001F2FAC3B|nr:aminodeoxychorismate lyase [Cytobacillus spongiae]UII56035.1 aminodeoxychorismate lyase [Cytobacillus spongiae]
MYVYFNGSVIKKEEVLISPFDHGFLYGLGLFETFRIYDGHPFLLDDHLARLNDGLTQLNIQAQFSRETILDAIQQLLAKNGITHANIRLNVSAGVGEIGLQTDSYTSPNIMLFARPMEPAGDELQEKEAVWLRVKRNTPEGEVRLKSHHYLNNLLAKQEIKHKVNCEGIFLTEGNYIAEGIVSNVFWVKNHTLYTPSVDTGILNGITRQFILQLAQIHQLDIQQGFFEKVSLLEADEVFVTNSIQEIVPISRIDKKSFPGKQGVVATQLHKDYRNYSSFLWSRKELKGELEC